MIPSIHKKHKDPFHTYHTSFATSWLDLRNDCLDVWEQKQKKKGSFYEEEKRSISL
jgi:hypothetical protein